MLLFIIILQLPIVDILDYEPQSAERQFVDVENHREIIPLDDYEVYSAATGYSTLSVCDESTVVIYDYPTSQIIRVKGMDYDFVTSGEGSGPLDLRSLQSMSCEGTTMAYFDSSLLRLTVVDLETLEIRYQEVFKRSVDQLHITGNMVYYLSHSSLVVEPFSWLNRVDITNGEHHNLFDINTNELGPGIVLTGVSAGNENQFCHTGVFSGLLTCFSLPESKLKFATSPVQKQELITVEDRSHLLDMPPGSAIGKNPEDKEISWSIALSDTYVFIVPVPENPDYSIIDVYSSKTGQYKWSARINDYRISEIDYSNGALYAVVVSKDEYAEYLIRINYKWSN